MCVWCIYIYMVHMYIYIWCICIYIYIWCIYINIYVDRYMVHMCIYIYIYIYTYEASVPSAQKNDRRCFFAR